MLKRFVPVSCLQVRLEFHSPFFSDASFTPGFMNLLIVEDNSKMRRMIKSIVACVADHIDECENGNEALALYSENLHDWILMDINLKETNGIDATREIISIYHDAKIIIVTNYNDAHFRDSAREAGAIDYILKENLLDILPLIKQ